ncbi:hypothetical protein CEXT_310271 [Caerostris extrusa]|uniref:Uncharacterized protein n=1 Tax=Caerostris extrusa TaxID=172846 RepID=A0AAV4M6G1_CAEEX|nr:hypothetical protein CEXT_310271 [Caerostris extrusa]
MRTAAGRRHARLTRCWRDSSARIVRADRHTGLGSTERRGTLVSLADNSVYCGHRQCSSGFICSGFCSLMPRLHRQMGCRPSILNDTLAGMTAWGGLFCLCNDYTRRRFIGSDLFDVIWNNMHSYGCWKLKGWSPKHCRSNAFTDRVTAGMGASMAWIKTACGIRLKPVPHRLSGYHQDQPQLI